MQNILLNCIHINNNLDKSFRVWYTNYRMEKREKMFDKDGNYYPNDDELNEFEESEETE